jgi:hypothetical protein
MRWASNSLKLNAYVGIRKKRRHVLFCSLLTLPNVYNAMRGNFKTLNEYSHIAPSTAMFSLRLVSA